MPSIFGKSGSTASRAKIRNKSIRGTISAPIPLPRSPEDDEFPIRNSKPAKASVAADDEFPMRTPGTGIAIPLPPHLSPGPSPEEPVEQPGEPAVREQQSQPTGDGEPGSDSSTEREQDQRKLQAPAPAAAFASVSGSSSDSRTDLLARETRPEPPSTPPPEPPQSSASRPTSRPASRSPPTQSSRKDSPLAVSPSPVLPPTRRATNPVLSTMRYSVVSDAPSKHTAQSKDAPQRKKSTLRSALGRLFGRGRKKNINGNQDSGAASARESAPLAPTQHHSDPTALVRPSRGSPHRSASLPISEFDRPLRSHSIGLEDIMAIESARNSLHAETEAPGSSTGAGIRRRAATTGGHTLLRPHLFNREFGSGLSPRPASAQGRAIRADRRPEAEDPSEIGRAIASDSGGGLRRRSRSLSGLPNFASAQPMGRRRSDEIRYWRESYDPGFMSPLSSNAQDDVDDTAMADVSAPDSPAVERPPKTPPQPFNFGLLQKEMIGMKITHAADMDTRLVNLESRTVQLERVVDHICHAVPGFKTPAGQVDMSQPGSSRRSIEPDACSQVLSGEYPANTGSLYPTSPSVPQAKAPIPSATPLASNRPASGSTARGAASFPTPGHGPSTTTPNTDTKTTRKDVNEVIAQLRADLDAERAARQALEAQVKKLSERVNTLSTTMFAMVRRAPSELSRSSQERLGQPGSSSSMALGSSPPKGCSSGLLVVQSAPAPAPAFMLLPQEQLSVFEETDDEDDDENGEGGDTEGRIEKKRQESSSLTAPGGLEEEGEITEDDFQTPREEGTPFVVGYGVLGEDLGPVEDDGDDDGREEGEEEEEEEEDNLRAKKAARTLSLSQLTLGKGQRTRI
ncbi:hypothetical protein N657DRAFT_676568 [Parathielavia appendiculata]|uniref:Uncharacterized protein n=1 Tax=Parathielavia appendiculata TaxID=2587402 RepID=A0AAN6U9Q2_9PEZI|nr:hypothetical protein N657DRAFT_676568 [Parathielavia appendiculata]